MLQNKPYRSLTQRAPKVPPDYLVRFANDRRPRFMQSAEEGFGCCGSLGGSKGGFGALWGGSRRWVGWLVVWLVFGWWKMGLGIGRGAIFQNGASEIVLDACIF